MCLCLCTQLEQREVALQQARTDAATARRQYRAAVEENGRLETRLQAFTFSAQTEQSQLSVEVRRREDTIQKLQAEHVALQTTIGRQDEQVH